MSLGSRIRQLVSGGREGEIRFDAKGGADLNILSPIRYSVKSRKAAWIAGSLVGFFITSTLVASIAFQLNRPLPSEYREVFLTDAPADLERFYLGLDQVLIGPEQYELNLLETRIDLLAHRGKEGGILIAAGNVPASRDPFVRVVFKDAEGCFASGCQPVPMENNVLKVAAGTSKGVMVDIDLETSLQASPTEGDATTSIPSLVFQPQVQNVWSRDPTTAYPEWQEAPFEYTAVPAAEDSQAGFPREGADPDLYPTSEAPAADGATGDGSGATQAPQCAVDCPTITRPPGVTADPVSTDIQQPIVTGAVPTTGPAATSGAAATSAPASTGGATATAAPATSSTAALPVSTTIPALPTLTTTAAPTTTTSAAATTTTTSAAPTTTTTPAPTNSPPDTPSGSSPLDLASLQSNSLTLTWNGGDSDSGQTVTYYVYFAAGSPPSTSGTPKCTTTVRTCATGSLSWGASHYWQVKAVDNAATAATTWGPVWRFTTNSAPVTPYSASPRDGATGMWVSLSLYWSGGDPDGTSPTYSVYFGTSSNPTTLLCTTTSTSCSTGALAYSTSYYWKVASSDGQLASTTNVWQFATQATASIACDLLTVDARLALPVSDPCHVTTVLY